MKTRSTVFSNQKGFTIIEMMISMVIFLVVISMVYQVMRLGIIQRNTINTKVDAVKGSRIALNYIRRDVINAGLSYHNIGGLIPDNFANTLIAAPSDSDTEQDLLTGIMAGNNVSSNILNSSNSMDSIGIISRDLSFNNGKFINFISTSQVGSGSSVAVKTAAGSSAICQKYDLYLFETGTTQVVGIVTSIDTTTDTLTLAVSPTDPLGINAPANGTGNSKSVLIGTGIKGTLKKITITTYTVSADGTLIRRTYGNQPTKTAAEQIETRELIANVQDFQVQYLLDDGTTTSDPSLGNDGRSNQQKMNRVVEVQVTLTVAQENDSQPQSTAPSILKEIISTRNLRYTIG